jgi:hypothetical protein
MRKIKMTPRDYRTINGKDNSVYCFGCKHYYRKVCILFGNKDTRDTKTCLYKK